MRDASGRTAPEASLIDAFGGFLSDRLGLDFPPERHAELRRHLDDLAGELGEPDADAWVRQLMSTPLAQDKVEALAGRLTIGETYFFREPEAFRAIEQEILPERIRARGAERRLRIWSAGCSTGEEAYSLAIVLERLGEALRGWDLTVLATDINAGVLRRAGIARYGDWSFRGVDSSVRVRHFQPVRNARHELHPALRERVTFSYLNLAGDAYPSLLTNTAAMDLILCRNVLMYFTPAAAALALARLRDSLVEGGWLVLGGVEIPLLRPPGMRVVRFEGATALQKVAPMHVAQAAEHMRASRRVSLPPEPTMTRERAQAREAAAPSSAALISQARRHADAGNLDAALACSREALDVDRLDPAAHYVHALIEIEAGRREEGARALRRAIFLAADFTMAHFSLASLALGQGKRAAARRHMETARTLLGRYAVDENVPGADGMNVGQLLRILNSMREQARGRD